MNTPEGHHRSRKRQVAADNQRLQGVDAGTCIVSARRACGAIAADKPPQDDIDCALEVMKAWMTEKRFENYHEAVRALIQLAGDESITKEERDEVARELVDSFRKQIKFGTGGRRGRVGIGPNRINPLVASLTAQGHADYVLQSKLAEGLDEATINRRGIVVASDVREFHEYYPAESEGMLKYRMILERSAGMKGFSSYDIDRIGAEVYAANGFHVYVPRRRRPTPWLSYQVRFLHRSLGDPFYHETQIAGAGGGTVSSSSHNLPDNNGQKYYVGGREGTGDGGGQLTPPGDAQLVAAGEAAKEIKRLPWKRGLRDGLIHSLTDSELRRLDEAYYQALLELFVDYGSTPQRAQRASWAFHAINGVGDTTLLEVVKRFGFRSPFRSSTDRHDPRFPDAFGNQPNPEVEETFRESVQQIMERHPDATFGVITDPDADRAGLMLKRGDRFVAANDNDEISLIDIFYTLQKWNERRDGQPSRFDALADSAEIGVVVNTVVSNPLSQKIVDYFKERYEQENPGKTLDLRLLTHLVGFKYTGEIISSIRNQRFEGITQQVFEQAGMSESDLAKARFIISHEEGEGGLIGAEGSVDKDATAVTLSLLHLAAELAEQGRTLIDYLDDIYKQVGYGRVGLEPIVLEGSRGEAATKEVQGRLRGERTASIQTADPTLDEEIDRWVGPYNSRPPSHLAGVAVRAVRDYWTGPAFQANTELESRNVLVFELADFDLKDIRDLGVEESFVISGAKVVVRPSGTEPKTKIAVYVPGPRLGRDASAEALRVAQDRVDRAWRMLLDASLLLAYDYAGLGSQMPHEPQDRLELVRLFFNLPTSKKLRYFGFQRRIRQWAEAVQAGSMPLAQAQEKARSETAQFHKRSGLEQIATSLKLRLADQLNEGADQEEIARLQAQVAFGDEKGKSVFQTLRDSGPVERVIERAHASQVVPDSTSLTSETAKSTAGNDYAAAITKNVALINELIETGQTPDVIGTVSGSVSAQNFWQQILDQAKGLFHAKASISFIEDLPTNQAFGLLLLWHRLRESVLAHPDEFGLDVIEAQRLLDAGELDLGVLTAFVFGAGTRSTPLTETDNAQKPAIGTPVEVEQPDGTKRYLSMVELAMRYFVGVQQYLSRSGFKGLVVKWGDEVQIPTRPLMTTDPLFADAAIVRFVSVQEMTDDTARNKDWVGVNERGEVTAFIPRRPIAEMAKLADRGLLQRREQSLYGGINLGSIAISYRLLDLLWDEFGSDVLKTEDDGVARGDRPALDPEFFTALTIAAMSDPAEREAAWQQAQAESSAVQALTQHAELGDVLGRLRRVLDRYEERYGQPIKTVAMDFQDQYWGDVGQHAKIYDFYMALNDAGASGEVARSIAGALSQRDSNGNLLVGDTSISPRAEVKNSVLLNATITGSGTVENTVLIGTRVGDITAKDAFDFGSTASKLTLAPRGGTYKVVSDKPVEARAGMRVTTVFMPESGTHHLRVLEETDLRNKDETYDVPILGNKVSFAQAHQEMGALSVSDLRQVRRKAERKVTDGLLVDAIGLGSQWAIAEAIDELQDSMGDDHTHPLKPRIAQAIQMPAARATIALMSPRVQTQAALLYTYFDRLEAATEQVVEQGGMTFLPNIRTGEQGYRWGPRAVWSYTLDRMGMVDAQKGDVLDPEGLSRLGLKKSTFVSERWFVSDDAQFPSWAQVDLDGSRVAVPLYWLLLKHPDDCLGERHVKAFGPATGMVGKYLDAAEPLSWQVHIGITEGYVVLQMQEGSGLYLGSNEPEEDERRLALIRRVRDMLTSEDPRVVRWPEASDVETAYRDVSTMIDRIAPQIQEDMSITELVYLLLTDGMNVVDVAGFGIDDGGGFDPELSLVQSVALRQGDRLITNERAPHALFGRTRDPKKPPATGTFMELKATPTGWPRVSTTQQTGAIADNLLGKQARPAKVIGETLKEWLQQIQSAGYWRKLVEEDLRHHGGNELTGVTQGVGSMLLHDEKQYAGRQIVMQPGSRVRMVRHGQHSGFLVRAMDEVTREDRGGVKVTVKEWQPDIPVDRLPIIRQLYSEEDAFILAKRRGQAVDLVIVNEGEVAVEVVDFKRRVAQDCPLPEPVSCEAETAAGPPTANHQVAND